MKTRLSSLVGAILVASLFPAAGVLPVQNEQIVVTCFSGIYNYYGAGSVTPNPNGFVVAQFDTSSGTIAPLLPLTTAAPALFKNPAGRGIPPLVGDVDIIIKNPTSAVMEMDIILFDTGGNTSYAASGPPWPAEANEMVQRLTIPPGESVPMLAAANLAVVGPGGGGVPVGPVEPKLVEAMWIRLCNNAQGYEILGSEIRFQPGGTGPLPLPEPGGTLPVSGVALGDFFGSPVMQLSTWSEPGAEYEAWSGTDLLHLGPGGKQVWPAGGHRMITGPGGSFLGIDGVMDLSLPATRGAPREFFKVRSVDPVFGKP